MKSGAQTHPPRRGAERSPSSRVETAYQRLKDDIIAGVYTPRQRLIETEIAPVLGVSRATLRAALIRLQHEGLVEIQPNRGAQVRSFSVEEATRILQVREVLEGLAAALAAAKATPAQLSELHDIVAEMEHTLAADDLLGHLPLVGRFHQRIIEVSGNEFIEQFLGMLRAPLIRHQFRVILVPGRKDESLTEHRDILTHLTRHDAGGAERAMRRHIAQLRNSLQQASHLPIH
ncbi:MAG TPA: GntR family transcriptional regulator [Candidatus Tectomicrobia bacterium]|nr:GntR family transcriptional regulator [Candidatus Tectomicrobia bacterium]